jgi:hypothetical protein
MPDLVADVRAHAGPRQFTAAVEEGLRWWLAREQRRQDRRAECDRAAALRTREHRLMSAVLAQILARLTTIDAGQTQLRAELVDQAN